MDSEIDIGKRIAKLRKAKGMSQEDLAKATNSSQGLIGKIETGTRKLQTDLLSSIATALGTDCDYILRGIRAKHISTADLGLSGEALKVLDDIGNGKDPGKHNLRDAVDFFLTHKEGLEIIERVYLFLRMRYDSAFQLKSGGNGGQIFKPEEICFVDNTHMILSKGFTSTDFDNIAALRIIDYIREWKKQLSDGEESR